MNNRNEVNKLKIMSCWIFVVVAIALGIRNVSDNNIDNNKSSVNSSKKNESIEEINNKEGLLAKSRSQEQNKSFSTDSDTLKSNEIKRLEDIAFERYIECKQLDERTSNAAKEMFNAALNDNVNLIAISGYRSYSVQENLYNSRVEVKGVEKTRQYTAEAGASEHQTGLAIDIVCNDYPYLDEGFENTDAFKWLYNNCYKYGFILRYQKGKEDITGYNYEPWHFRYIGNANIAKDIMDRGICFEEFINEVNSQIEELKGVSN